ncbi:maleylpyruvate isomerase N-terminal domain-containing protein [Chondromyces apiculatus]
MSRARTDLRPSRCRAPAPCAGWTLRSLAWHSSRRASGRGRAWGA